MTPVSHSERGRSGRLMQGAPWRVGRRRCLLKGCEQTFRPWHPLGRYCSSNCRAAARRWRQRTANRRYRASEQGKCRRRAQACRYRQRRRTCMESDSVTAGEGYPHPGEAENTCCGRPGCYQTFARTARSPLQRFCSAGCRQALRRVLLRERRWKRILGLEAKRARQAHDSW
jgi:hypothetical protein